MTCLPKDLTLGGEQYTTKSAQSLKSGCEFHTHGSLERIQREDLKNHHADCAPKHSTRSNALNIMLQKSSNLQDDMHWSETQTSWKVPIENILPATDGEDVTFSRTSERFQGGKLSTFSQPKRNCDRRCCLGYCLCLSSNSKCAVH